MSPEQKRAIAASFVTGLAGGGRIDQTTLAAGWTIWNCVHGEMSPQRYLDSLQVVEAVAPGWRIWIEGTTAEADRVAVQARSAGVLTNGVLYENHYHFLFEFAGDRIQRVSAYFNPASAEVLVRAIAEHHGG